MDLVVERPTSRSSVDCRLADAAVVADIEGRAEMRRSLDSVRRTKPNASNQPVRVAPDWAEIRSGMVVYLNRSVVD